jgi:hypothetical protein
VEDDNASKATQRAELETPEAGPEFETPEFEPPEATGEPRVDAALRQLGELSDLPVSEHPPVFERIHASLVDVLGELRSTTVNDQRQ